MPWHVVFTGIYTGTRTVHGVSIGRPSDVGSAWRGKIHVSFVIGGNAHDERNIIHRFTGTRHQSTFRTALYNSSTTSQHSQNDRTR